ncbi:MAG TPA: MFS transporter [Pseudomonadales bacterium]
MTPTRRIAATWYAYGYARELVLIFPVYAIMMGEHGVSPIELSILFFVWSASALVFEVPSGVIADRYSRKRLLVAAALIRGSVFVIWWLVPDFTGYLVGFVVWSLGSSLVSGTSESFLYDTLRTTPDAASAHDRTFARIYGRGMVAHSLGVATALLGGGYLAESGYEWGLALSIVAPWVAAAIVAFGFVEPPRGGAPIRTSHRATLLAGLAEVRNSRTVSYIVAMFAALVTGYGVIDEYVGPFLAEKPAFSLGIIGVVYAAAFAMRTVGMELAHRLPWRSLRAIALLFALGASGLAATVTVDHLWLIATLGGYFAACAAGEVLLQTRLQNTIESAARATVTSIAKMAQHACELLFYVLIGATAQLWSFQVAFASVAVLTLLLAMVFAAAPKR